MVSPPLLLTPIAAPVGIDIATEVLPARVPGVPRVRVPTVKELRSCEQ